LRKGRRKREGEGVLLGMLQGCTSRSREEKESNGDFQVFLPPSLPPSLPPFYPPREKKKGKKGREGSRREGSREGGIEGGREGGYLGGAKISVPASSRKFSAVRIVRARFDPVVIRSA
jgi:hypothetical protein